MRVVVSKEGDEYFASIVSSNFTKKLGPYQSAKTARVNGKGIMKRLLSGGKLREANKVFVPDAPVSDPIIAQGEWEAARRLRTPGTALVTALLDRAILDLSSPYRDIRAQAWAWFMEDNPAPCDKGRFDFVTVADVLGLDVGEVRQSLHKMRQENSLPTKSYRLI